MSAEPSQKVATLGTDEVKKNAEAVAQSAKGLCDAAKAVKRSSSISSASLRAVRPSSPPKVGISEPKPAA